MKKSILRKILKKIGSQDTKSTKNPVVTLKPKTTNNKHVLLSYVIDPFLLSSKDAISNDHTHHWESYTIAEIFLNHGYTVDVIHFTNRKFIPEKNYSYFISARTNLDKIAEKINSDCIVVAHLDTAHWLYNNTAAYNRLLDAQQRLGTTLTNAKMVKENLAIENADLATILGNQFTIDTYTYAKKPIYRIPISAPTTYPWDANKNFESCKKNYLWFGSSGFVHKGLDLAIEAFSQLPEFNLTICGPLEDEQAFVNAYTSELYNTSNINTVGWVDVTSEKFIEIMRTCVALIYPTCSEGGGGSVITCMHGGLIPVVSYEASVDIEPAGLILKDCSIEEIKNSAKSISSLSSEELEKRARQSQEIAQNNHTRKTFHHDYNKFVTEVLFNWEK